MKKVRESGLFDGSSFCKCKIKQLGSGIGQNQGFNKLTIGGIQVVFHVASPL